MIEMHYTIHAASAKFARTEAETLEAVRNTLRCAANVSVSVSGGKDSVVMLHLITQVAKELPHLNVYPVFFDTGSLYPETLPLLEEIETAFGIEFTIIEPEYTVEELYRKCGTFGYRGEEYEGWHLTEHDYKEILILAPAHEARELYNLDITCIGTRKEESHGRKYFLGKLHNTGYLHCVDDEPFYNYYPLANWTGEDIWAYTYKHELPYHPVYNKLAFVKDRERQRVAHYLVGHAFERSHGVFLKKYYPEIWNRIRAEFPQLGKYA
jgi:phosphoadenosine phosphosulfate reductase